MDRQVPSFEVHSFQEKKTRYCICIFVINEGEKLLKQLSVMEEFADIVDIVIADGGSDDGSTELDGLKLLRVNALLVKTGQGKLGAQMRMAFAWAIDRGYEGVILIDGNGKDDVVAVPSFIRKLDEGWDHVQGSRFLPGGTSVNLPLTRWFGLRFIHAPLMRLVSGFPYSDTTNGFRAYSTRLLLDSEIAVFRTVFSGYELHYYLAVQAVKRGYKVTEIPVVRKYPEKGPIPSKISPLKGNLQVLRKLMNVCFGVYDLKVKQRP